MLSLRISISTRIPGLRIRVRNIPDPDPSLEDHRIRIRHSRIANQAAILIENPDPYPGDQDLIFQLDPDPTLEDTTDPPKTGKNSRIRIRNFVG